MARVFTFEDVLSHNTKDDLYLIVRSKVYDISPFVDEHPGGHEILLDIAGKDATGAYDDAGHSDEATEILQELQVGVLGDMPAPSVNEHAKVVATTPKINAAVAAALKPDEFQDFALVEKTVVSHNVAIYRYKLPDPEMVLGLPIGQHISIGALIVQPSGAAKEIIRSYTPITGDDQPGYFDLLVKSYPQGNMTQHLASLVIGQSIRVRGPKGAFTYEPNMVRRFGMIAGGTGITPMLHIIRAILRGRKSGDVTGVDLVFANVNEEDILLRAELDAISKEDGDIRVHHVLNNPPEGWAGGVGFVSADMFTNWMPKPASDIKILLCGPPPMVSAMKKIAEAWGYEKARPVSRLEDQVFAF